MKKTVRFLCMLLVVTMALFTVAGCGTATPQSTPVSSTEPASTEAVATSAVAATATPAPTIDTSTPVVLKYYMIGDEQKDSQVVWDAINKKMSADINTTINPVIISWADYSTKYPLIFASGEDFDMCWTGNWMGYADIASKGGLMEITQDMIDKYCPDAMKQLPESSLKQARVNGKLYMIPFGEKTTDNICIVTRGDLKEKYGIGAINSLADLEKYCDAVVLNEKGIVPLADESPSNFALELQLLYHLNNWGYVDRTLGLAYSLTDPNPKVFSVLDRPEFLTFINTMNDFKTKGYISKSALTFTGSSNSEFAAGRGAVGFGNLNDLVALYQQVNTAHPEWKIQIENGDWGGKIASQPAILHGTSIHATSKNPERVLMATELLAYHQDYNGLVLYGVQGTNYNNDNGAYVPLNSDYVGTNYSTWAFRGQYLLKPANAFSTYDTLYQYQVDNTVTSPLCAFSLMTTNIKSQEAACANIWQNNVYVLMYGPVTDAAKGIADAKAALDSAGYEQIFTEANTQATQYLADYNK